MAHPKIVNFCFVLFAIFASSSFVQGWNVGESFTGDFTYYDDQGFGACGTQIDASSQMLVAISHTQWAGGNPNNDPICKNICLQVEYNGKRYFKLFN